MPIYKGLFGSAKCPHAHDQGAVYRWLGGEGFAPPVVFLTREDGTPTSKVAEMNALVRRAWAPINLK